MIKYSPATPWVFARLHGSAAPKAFRWALPCAALAVLYHWVLHEHTEIATHLMEPSAYETTSWSLFTSVLGFLLVFRTQLSYSRYWEGITLVERACSVWLNGCSNLVAFCSADQARQIEVKEFQYTLSRLVSLLVCYSMCDISRLDRTRFPHLDLSGIDPASIKHLEGTSSRQNIALQWVQRLIIENSRSGVIDVAAPILSRVFQEFSIGYVHFTDANKITTVPFPFVMAQMVWMTLAFFSVLPLPMMCAAAMDPYRAAAYTFSVVFVFWSVHHIAVEIELPFGDDENDLPLDEVNHRFNVTLQRLLEVEAQTTPKLIKDRSQSLHLVDMQGLSSFEFVTDRTETETGSTTARAFASLMAAKVSFSRSSMGPRRSRSSRLQKAFPSMSRAFPSMSSSCSELSGNADHMSSTSIPPEPVSMLPKSMHTRLEMESWEASLSGTTIGSLATAALPPTAPPRPTEDEEGQPQSASEISMACGGSECLHSEFHHTHGL